MWRVRQRFLVIQRKRRLRRLRKENPGFRILLQIRVLELRRMRERCQPLRRHPPSHATRPTRRPGRWPLCRRSFPCPKAQWFQICKNQRNIRLGRLRFSRDHQEIGRPPQSQRRSRPAKRRPRYHSKTSTHRRAIIDKRALQRPRKIQLSKLNVLSGPGKFAYYSI